MSKVKKQIDCMTTFNAIDKQTYEYNVYIYRCVEQEKRRQNEPFLSCTCQDRERERAGEKEQANPMDRYIFFLSSPS